MLGDHVVPEAEALGLLHEGDLLLVLSRGRDGRTALEMVPDTELQLHRAHDSWLYRKGRLIHHATGLGKLDKLGKLPRIGCEP